MQKIDTLYLWAKSNNISSFFVTFNKSISKCILNKLLLLNEWKDNLPVAF